MNAPKGQALRTIWNIRRTIPNGKGSTSDAKNRRKGMLDALACNLTRLCNITQDGKFKRRFKKFLQKKIRNEPIKARCYNILI